MSPRELATWTDAMIRSGKRLDLSAVPLPTVDKHSTGGVGDKISLPLCPLVAACGAAVPQLSGRGLGHTGGTLDKLEAIPGFRVDLTRRRSSSASSRSVGAVICAAGPDLAPADRKLYALRDVTGTVESIPLIASSIMSKKIAEGTAALVLDVKVGDGAFMRDRDRARELARTMVELGDGAGRAHRRRCSPTWTRRSAARPATPWRCAESVEVLAGGGPADVVELTLALAREMLELAGIDADPAEALARRPRHGPLAPDGRAPRAATPTRRCPWRAHVEEVRAGAAGVVERGGRPGGGRGRVAARRRARAQGRPGERRGRGGPARRAGGHGGGRAGARRAARRRRGPPGGRAGPPSPGRSGSDRPRPRRLPACIERVSAIR